MKTPELGGEHIAADDRALVDEQAGLDAALTGGVVGDLIGVPLDALAAVVGQIEALHDTARGIQHHILTINDIVGQRCPERRRRVERRLLQRSYGTTRRIAAVTGRDDRRAEGAERHQPGLIDRSDTLVRGSPSDRSPGIGRTGRGDQPENFPPDG